MSNLPVVLEPQSFAELKRLVFQQQRELTSLRRSLQHVAVRRHQAVWMPSSGKYYSYKSDTYTLTSATLAALPTGSITSPNGQSYGQEDISYSGGEITFAADGHWTFQLKGSFNLTLRRDEEMVQFLHVQYQTGGGAWNTLVTVRGWVGWANVALNNVLTGMVDDTSQFRRIDVLAGDKLRLATETNYYTSIWTGGTVGGYISLFDNISTLESE